MERGLVQRLYNRLLRPHLPRKYGVFAGVTARDKRLLDTTNRMDDYKHGLLDAIHEHVTEGDYVTIVGFGRGVTTVHALREGPARVTGYEAASGMIDVGRETIALADVNDAKVNVVHAVVGEAIDVFGSTAGARCVDPANLTGDVLICDCEGAELSILDGLDADAFDRYVIETHPRKGASAADVVSRMPAECDVRIREHHRDKPRKAVVVATR